MHLNKFALAFAGLLFCAPAFLTMAPEPAMAQAPAAGSYIKDINDIAGATEMLKAVDKNHNPFKDQWIKTSMVLNGGVHKNVTYKFDTYTKGTNRRAVRFFEPADMRGMGVVTKGRSDVYARLPDSQKVRRVGAHAKRQSFYGSDWSMDDMSMIYMADDYDIVKILDLNADNGSHVKLELKLKTVKDGKELSADDLLPYPKLVIKLDKKLMFMDYIEYYDEGGKLIKTQERSDPKDLGNGHLLYTHVKVTDAATKHTTENFVSEEKCDTNIPDDTFTSRWLTRGI